MSFIIKGLDIPKTCRQCPCCADNGLVGVQRDYYCVALDCVPSVGDLDQKLTDCPLVEIPTPHSRLIDADKFLKDNTDFADRDFIHPSSEVTLRELIDEAPTIIEAEVSE